MPAKAGIQWRSKHAVCWLGLVPDQARNDGIHGIFWPDRISSGRKRVLRSPARLFAEYMLTTRQKPYEKTGT